MEGKNTTLHLSLHGFDFNLDSLNKAHAELHFEILKDVYLPYEINLSFIHEIHFLSQTTFMQGTTEVLSIASTSAKGKGLELVILGGVRLIHD